jgi:hypothetical protein
VLYALDARQNEVRMVLGVRRASWVLAGWTAFVWVTRIKNADGDVGATIIAVAFVALAIAVAVRHRAAIALAAVTIVVWLVRTPMILLHHHDGAFKAVHTVLAVVSIALSAWVLREVDVERKRQAPATAAGLEELADR